MKPDPQHFRSALASLAAGVAVITTRTKTETVGITVSSFTSLSLQPALVQFSLDNASSHLRMFKRGKKFAANLLGENQKLLSQHFAAAGKKSWLHVAHKDDAQGSPIIDDIITALSCTIVATHKHGDHTIIIGRVDAIAPIQKDAKPLLYFRKHYHQLGDTIEQK